MRFKIIGCGARRIIQKTVELSLEKSLGEKLRITIEQITTPIYTVIKEQLTNENIN